MEVSKNENKNTGIPKKYIYVLAAAVIALGLFFALNAYSFFSGSTQQSPSYSIAPYSQPNPSGGASGGGVIPSQVGGCG